MPQVVEVGLKAAKEPLEDLALLMLDTALRDGEALALKWPDVHMKLAPTAKFGYLQVQKGKSTPDYLVASATPNRLWLRSLAPRICSYPVDLRAVPRPRSV